MSDEQNSLLIEAFTLRNAIYDTGSTHNWVACAEHWAADIEWLRNNAPPQAHASEEL